MVAVISTSTSISNALNYNEQKVTQQVAVCIDAGNYPKDAEDLNFDQKLARLEHLSALNKRTSVNSVHISLNFDPSEKLSVEKLKEIAAVYLEKIGFKDQPYLLYQHNDSGHPHVHIVTTNIKADGKRIELHNLGRNQSEKARKEIEVSFGLTKAGDSRESQAYELKSAYTAKAQYGRSETKRAITNVLDAVLPNYKYTSLHELNAVLQQYNVLADRGSENSRVFKNHGLIYRIIDEHGNKEGVPIKASDFYNKPTLKFLEGKFAINDVARTQHKTRIKNAVDLSLLRQPNQSLESLVKSLERDGIKAVLRQNKEGVVYGVTYVDHQTKCVFNGSDLGKQYSANALQKRCTEALATHPAKTPTHEGQQSIPGQHRWSHDSSQSKFSQSSETISNEPFKNGSKDSLLETLLKPEYWSAYVPGQLTKKRKKKKKRLSNR